MRKLEKFVLFGHTGFIGKNIKRRMEDLHFDVDFFSSAQADLTVSSEVEKLEALFDENTTVILCSAIKRQAGDTLDNFNKNILMVMNICKVLEKKTIKCFVFISSTAVYGEDIYHEIINEETHESPSSYYGIYKLSSELILKRHFSSRTDSSLLILRPPAIYGLGENDVAYGPASFIDSVLKGKPAKMWGDGSEYREFLYIDDMVDILITLINKKAKGIFNIVSGTSYTFKEILNIIFQIFEKDVEIQSKPRSKNKVDVYFDNKKLKQTIPDLYFSDIKEGLKILCRDTRMLRD